MLLNYAKIFLRCCYILKVTSLKGRYLYVVNTCFNTIQYIDAFLKYFSLYLQAKLTCKVTRDCHTKTLSVVLQWLPYGLIKKTKLQILKLLCSRLCIFAGLIGLFENMATHLSQRQWFLSYFLALLSCTHRPVSYPPPYLYSTYCLPSNPLYPSLVPFMNPCISLPLILPTILLASILLLQMLPYIIRCGIPLLCIMPAILPFTLLSQWCQTSNTPYLHKLSTVLSFCSFFQNIMFILPFSHLHILLPLL